MRARAVLVDGEVVDHRLHGEGNAALELSLGLAHDERDAILRRGFDGGVEEEAHAAAGHAAEHPESPEAVAELGAHLLDEALGVGVGRPGNDGLNGVVEVVLCEAADAADVARSQTLDDVVKQGDGLLPRAPFGCAAQQVFLGDHFENGPDVLSHAAVHEHETGLQFGACLGADALEREDGVPGQQAAAADAKLDITLLRVNALNELHAGPDAAGVLPAAAAAAEPLAQDGAGGDQPAVGFLEGACRANGSGRWRA